LAGVRFLETKFGSQTAMEAGRTRFWWLSLAVLTLGYLLWTYGALRQATSARWQDTSGYLAHALYIAEHGGLWGFLRECFTGTFPITERHPLYMLMLAPIAARTAEFFWYARIIDLVTGLAVLLSLVWMVARRYGSGAALIAGVMYALSSSLVIAASHVDNELQFTLCTLWAWWFLTDTSDATNAADALPSSVARWALAGAWLGLAFLAKSPAVLIGVAIVVAALWYSRLRLATDRRLWALLVAATLLSSPLLVRNLVGHGTLFYEGVNSSIMWIDDWTDIGGEHSTIYYDQYGVTTIETNGMPTAAEYFRTHSLSDVAHRMASGFANEVRNVIPSALGAGLGIARGRTLGFLIFALAAAGWWLRRRSWDATVVLFWSAAFLAFFSWDTMFPEIRYLAPLVPVWIAFAAHAAWTLCMRLLKPAVAVRFAAGATILAVLGVLGWTAAAGAFTKPYPTMEASPSYLRYVEWVNRTFEPGDRIMIGETREFHGLIWMIDRPTAVLLMPNSKTVDEFLRYLRERNSRYLLMHPEYLTGVNRELAAALAPYFEQTAQGSIVEKQPLPGWRQVYVDEGASPHFIVYEADAFAKPGIAPQP
jgi:4-amino-4-deoxy-L-arabinose transferase-like glycosyltransferase